jgi:hypothetical protein
MSTPHRVPDHKLKARPGGTLSPDVHATRRAYLAALKARATPTVSTDAAPPGRTARQTALRDLRSAAEDR